MTVEFLGAMPEAGAKQERRLGLGSTFVAAIVAG
jgi:hypothetical protein